MANVSICISRQGASEIILLDLPSEMVTLKKKKSKVFNSVTTTMFRHRNKMQLKLTIVCWMNSGQLSGVLQDNQKLTQLVGILAYS